MSMFQQGEFNQPLPNIPQQQASSSSAPAMEAQPKPELVAVSYETVVINTDDFRMEKVMKAIVCVLVILIILCAIGADKGDNIVSKQLQPVCKCVRNIITKLHKNIMN